MEVNVEAIDEHLKALSGQSPSTVGAQQDNSSPEDDIAIAQAIQEVESELKTEQKAQQELSGGFVPYLDVDVNEIDQKLRELPRKKTSGPDDEEASDSTQPEDDIAIGEAIQQIESELRQEHDRVNGLDRILEVDVGEIDRKLRDLPAKKSSAEPDDGVADNTRPEDDIAIAAAIEEIESELRHQSERSNHFAPLLEVDVTEIDKKLQGLPKRKNPQEKEAIDDNTRPEDDIAIAEAIKEIESEMKSRGEIKDPDASRTQQFAAVFVAFVAGALISSLYHRLFGSY